MLMAARIGARDERTIRFDGQRRLEDKALVLEKTVSVADGNLSIGFVRQVQNPKINAIEILSSP